LIDRIRYDMEERLDQLLAEAEKLRLALLALGSRDGSAPSVATRSQPAPTKAKTWKRSRTSSPSAGSAVQPATVPTRRRLGSGSTESPTRGARTAPGATKTAVLAALASGEAMTAGDVAAATGLGRATLSTTLSNLAKAGEVNKAARGYRLAEPPKAGV
jgi:DNA-binding transcriptional ArsR family regulator